MPSAATFAMGTALKMGDGAGTEVFNLVAEVLDINGPNIAADTIEVTNHDSSNYFKEFKGGAIDPGEVSFSVNFIPSSITQNDTSTGLFNKVKTRAVTNWKIVTPTSPTYTLSFAGIVTAFQPKFPVNDRMTADVTIKVTGVPTLATP